MDKVYRLYYYRGVIDSTIAVYRTMSEAEQAQELIKSVKGLDINTYIDTIKLGIIDSEFLRKLQNICLESGDNK